MPDHATDHAGETVATPAAASGHFDANRSNVRAPLTSVGHGESDAREPLSVPDIEAPRHRSAACSVRGGRETSDAIAKRHSRDFYFPLGSWTTARFSILVATMLLCADVVGRAAEWQAVDAVAPRQQREFRGGVSPRDDTRAMEEIPAPAQPRRPMEPDAGRAMESLGSEASFAVETRPSSRGRSPWLRPFEARAFDAGDVQESDGALAARLSIPASFVPWWQTPVVNALRPRAFPYRVNVHSLVYDALKYSPFVHGISKTPLIREFKIVEAEAEFDVTTFMESKFLAASEPVGSALTTGGPPRYRDRDWNYSGGVRKRTWTGGKLELSQQFGYQDNNSNFFIPKQQGTARLALSYTQPFLNGRGRVYNTSLIVLAQIDTGIAWDQFSEQLQEHLLDVTRTYWELYLGRASLLQRRRHHERAKTILDELEGRRAIDALESQIAVARAAVATRRVALARAEMTVRNAETRLRSLVTAPELTRNNRLELIPTELPTHAYLPVTARDAMLTALDKRPEVDDALRQIRAASVRLHVAKNELLPILNFVMETYVSGLEGRSEVATAWANQFNQGEPSYSVGLQFEIPLYNRAAIARHKRRQLEVGRVVDQFKSRMEILMAEVEVAVREVNTYYKELFGTYRALLAAESEYRYLRKRWNLLPGEDQSTSFLLEDLLNSQDRLATAEFLFAKAEIAYTVSLSNLSRVMGTLLEREQVSVQPVEGVSLPQPDLNSPPPANVDLPRPGVVREIIDGNGARRLLGTRRR